MSSTVLLRWVGWSAVFAVLVGQGGTSAREARPQPTQAKAPRAKAPAARKPKHKAIPLQGLLRLAKESNNRFKVEESAYRELTELHLTTGQFTSPGASLQSTPQQQVPQTFEILCYNKQPVGPVIRVRPGTTFKIRVHNDLAEGKPDSDPTGTLPGDIGATFEKPHGLCTTNLHTHGLHVSPSGDADDIFRLIEPKCNRTFTYTIKSDHPSGTFWYHPHKHGSVAYQLSNGLAGALIVEREKKTESRKEDGPARYLEHVPEIANAEEQVLVLQLYNFRVGSNKIGRIDASTLYNIKPDGKGCEQIKVTGDDPPDPNNPPRATAINGAIVPTIQMAPGEVQRWRIIHGSWDELKPLTFADDQDRPTTALKFWEIAVDGLATGGMEGKDVIDLAPGQRSDVLIQAPKVAEGQTATYFLKQADVPSSRSLHGHGSDPLFLAKIVVCTDPKRKPKSFRLPKPEALFHCRAFDSVRDYELSPPPKEFQNGILFNGYDKDTTYTIGGKTFHAYKQDVPIAFGTAQEWMIKAAPPVDDQDPNNHPFHLHVNPFQVVMYTDPGGKSKPMNVWRDTLLIRGGESYTIRTRFHDYKGRTVLHCHILDHEDQGMMVPLNITDQPEPPAGKLKPATAPAPALKLPDPSGTSHELSEFRRHKVLLVFVQGMDCIHCAETLRDLVRQSRETGGFDAEIVAVSGRRVADPARALRVLGVSSTDRFHLLVDEGLRAFRAFGCYDGAAMHGLFLIDGDGIIRARYTGESPFSDAGEAVRQTRALPRTGARLASP